MFRYKYVAVNTLTDINVKGFYTLWGVKRWMRRPMKMVGLKFDKFSFLKVYEVAREK